MRCWRVRAALMLVIGMMLSWGAKGWVRRGAGSAAVTLRVLRSCPSVNNCHTCASEARSKDRETDFIIQNNDLVHDDQRNATRCADDVDNATIEFDPHLATIKAREDSLRAALSSLDGSLRVKRVSLAKLREKVSESGRAGFFLIQAQVNDFRRKKEAEQKQRVLQNKKDFVDKMLPIVDMFRAAPITITATTEREENMHRSFGALLDSIVSVIEKFGYAHVLESENAMSGSPVSLPLCTNNTHKGTGAKAVPKDTSTEMSSQDNDLLEAPMTGDEVGSERKLTHAQN